MQEVVCRRTLRLMAGRRETFDASWNGRAVILKVFAHPWKARLHARRERRGFERLAQRGIAAPAVLLSGRTDDGRWAVATEKIEGAVSLQEARAMRGEFQQWDALLGLAACELARLHEQGVVQRDFHPGNFLVKGDRLFVLDPGQIRFLSHPVGRTIAIRQLAHLACILVPDDRSEAIELICAGYAGARRWDWGQSERALFFRWLGRGRREGIRRAARRPLHKGRDHVRVRMRHGFAVGGKAFAESGDFAGLVKDIDLLMESGCILERRSAFAASCFDWESREVTATRFDDRGLLRTAAGIIRGTRGRRRWITARQSGALSIATARPLALIERRDGLLQSRSYLLTESVHGRTLCDFVCDRGVPIERRRDVVQQVFAVLDRLARYGITWARFDPQDVLVRDDRPVFMACNDMVIHASAARCWRRFLDQREQLIRSMSDRGLDSETLGPLIAAVEASRSG